MKILRLTIKVLLLAGTILTVGLKAENDNDQLYLQMEIVGRDGATLQSFNEEVRGGCYIAPGESCNGMFYLNSEGGAGMCFGSIYSDVIQSQQTQIVYEIVYNLTVVKDYNQYYLKGLLYSLTYGDDEIVKSGQKYVVNRRVELDSLTILPFLEVPGRRDMALQVTINGSKTNNSPVISANRLQINSVCYKDGKLAGKLSDRVQVDLRGIAYSAEFDLGRNKGENQILRYQVAARLSRDIYDIADPTECEVIFSRSCALRSFNQEDEVISSGLTFTSTISKTVVVNPGEKLKLIFPPESPPVQGIEIEDTLTIDPR